MVSLRCQSQCTYGAVCDVYTVVLAVVMAYGTSGGELVIVRSFGVLFRDAAGWQYPAACSAEAAPPSAAQCLV